MRIYHLAQDLLLTARTSAAARSLGLPYETVGSAAALIERLPAGEEAVVAVDLDHPGVEIAALAAALRRGTAVRRIIAYAAHVHADRLLAAREAGCDEVLTRGQFDRLVRELLTRHANAPPSAGSA